MATQMNVNKVEHGQVSPNGRWSIAKEYLDTRLSLHIHIGFATEEYCARLNRGMEEGHLGDSVVASPGRPSNSTTEDNAPSEYQVGVLICVTQDLKLPEILPVIVLPRTIARLKRIYDGAYCVGHPSELAPLLSFILDGIIEDGEFITSVGDLSERLDKLPNEMVERGAEVIENVSNDGTQVVGHGRHLPETMEFLSRLRININRDTIGLEVTEGRQLMAKRLDILTGPAIQSFPRRL